MATERRSSNIAPILLAAASLMWPALWNGYPLVFSDTGTYLSQAIEHYAGWDRPVFYSLFLLPLHLTITTWPVVAAQALLIVYTLYLVRRVLWPGSSAWWLLPVVLVLTITTSLPWLVCQLMPDVFTGPLVLALALLIIAPQCLSRRECLFLTASTTFMIASHQSHLLLAAALIGFLLPLRGWLGGDAPLGRRGLGRAIAPLALAAVALVSVNLLAFGRLSLSPFGKVFLLARVIYDGPGMDVLRRDCPTSGWHLCAFVDRMPATSDEFLWRPDGPVVLAGGAKRVSLEAGDIISAALHSEPGAELRAVARNIITQLVMFATGDGLIPWPDTVAPAIERNFPHFEAAAFRAARESNGSLQIPGWLSTSHIIVALSGIVGLPLALRKRHPIRGLAAAIMLALLVNAAVTGGLSTPHHRYQSRIIWLPPLVLLLAAPAAARMHSSLRVAPRLSWKLQGPSRTVPATHNHAANVLWSGVEATASAILSFASAFIVARVIGPTEVGIGAAAVAVHVLLWVAVNALFADALVQRSTLDSATISSAVLASIAIGCAASLIQAGTAAPLQWLLADHRLIPMSLLLALPLPLVGAAGPVQGLLTRNRAYKTLALRTLIGQGLGTAVGIGSAMGGAGAWALVLQQMTISAAGALTLLLHSPVRLGLTASCDRLRELLRIGLPLTASTLTYHGRYRLFALLIGGTAGAAALGQVHMAFRLIDAVRELAFTAQWRLMLPILSERQDDLQALHDATDRCLAWSSLLTFPLCAALAVSIQPLVAVLLGPVWQPCGVAALPLIALAAWLFLAFPAGVAVVARGEPRYALIANIVGTTATALGVMLIRPATPLDGVLVWLGGQIFVSPYVLYANAHVLHTRPFRPLRAGVPMATASLLAAIAAIILPRAIGGPTSPTLLLVIRLAIMLAIVSPVALRLIGDSGPARSPSPRTIPNRRNGGESSRLRSP